MSTGPSSESLKSFTKEVACIFMQKGIYIYFFFLCINKYIYIHKYIYTYTYLLISDIVIQIVFIPKNEVHRFPYDSLQFPGNIMLSLSGIIFYRCFLSYLHPTWSMSTLDTKPVVSNVPKLLHQDVKDTLITSRICLLSNITRNINIDILLILCRLLCIM